jgi:hypothetical protein
MRKLKIENSPSGKTGKSKAVTETHVMPFPWRWIKIYVPKGLYFPYSKTGQYCLCGSFNWA